MQTQTMLKRFGLLLGLFLAIAVIAAPVSRVTNFVDSEVLTAAQLNSEFNNVIGGVNSINNAQIATNAAISPAKIASTIKGDAINRNASTGALSVKADDVTLEISGDNLQIKSSGVDTTQIADDAVTTAKILDDNITTDKIADNAVTFAKGVNRNFIEDDNSTYQPIGRSVYDDETLVTCNSAFCGGSFNNDLSIKLNVSGTRPVIFIGSSIPGTSIGGVKLEVSTLSPVVATGELEWQFQKNGDSRTLQGQWGMTFKADSNSQAVSWPCDALSTVFFPTSAGEWEFGVTLGPIGPGSNVTSSITNCRVTAYEL